MRVDPVIIKKRKEVVRVESDESAARLIKKRKEIARVESDESAARLAYADHHTHLFVMDYNLADHSEMGNYPVFDFTHTLDNLDYQICIFHVIDAHATHYFKVEVTGRDHIDYLRLAYPLLVDIRYLAYYVIETLSVTLNNDGKMQTSLDLTKWHSNNEFLHRMYDLERKFSLAPVSKAQ